MNETTVICVYCGGNFVRTTGKAGRPPRFCSDECKRDAKTSNMRYCQHCRIRYASDNLASSFCPEHHIARDTDGNPPTEMRRRTRCATCLRAIDRPDAYCSAFCKGAAPKCGLPECHELVPVVGLRAWGKACSDAHRLLTTANPNVDRELQARYEVFRANNAGEKLNALPIKAHGAPYWVSSRRQRCITPDEFGKDLRKKYDRMIAILEQATKMSDQTQDRTQDPKRSKFTRADWAFLFGPGLWSLGMWELMPWAYNYCPSAMLNDVTRYVNATRTKAPKDTDIDRWEERVVKLPTDDPERKRLTKLLFELEEGMHYPDISLVLGRYERLLPIPKGKTTMTYYAERFSKIVADA